MVVGSVMVPNLIECEQENGRQMALHSLLIELMDWPYTAVKVGEVNTQ